MAGLLTDERQDSLIEIQLLLLDNRVSQRLQLSISAEGIPHRRIDRSDGGEIHTNRSTPSCLEASRSLSTHFHVSSSAFSLS